MVEKRRVRTPRRRSSALRKVPTGIRGLDAVLQGGLPMGRSTLLVGGPGAGKSVLLNEFIYRGIQDYDEPGVYVTFEEAPGEIVRNVAGFGWNYASLQRAGKLVFVDASQDATAERELPDDRYDLSPLLIRVRNAVRKVGARRLVIDGLDALFGRLTNRPAIRELVLGLGHEAAALGVTCLLAALATSDERLSSTVDGMVLQRYVERGQRVKRLVTVLKLRGSAHNKAIYTYDIDRSGVVIGDRYEA